MALNPLAAANYDRQAKNDKIEQKLLEVRVAGTEELERKKATKMIRDIETIESQVQKMLGDKNGEKAGLVEMYYEQIAQIYFSSINMEPAELKSKTIPTLQAIRNDLDASYGLLSRYEKKPLRDFLTITEKKIQSRISVVGRLKQTVSGIAGNGILMGALAGAVTHSPAVWMAVTAYNLMKKQKTGSPTDQTALHISKQMQSRSAAERSAKETKSELQPVRTPQRMPARGLGVPSFDTSPTHTSDNTSSGGHGGAVLGELTHHSKKLNNIEKLLAHSLTNDQLKTEEAQQETTGGSSPVRVMATGAQSGKGLLGKLAGLFNLRTIFSAMAGFLPMLGGGLLTALTPVIPTLLAAAGAAWGIKKVVEAGSIAFNMFRERGEGKQVTKAVNDAQSRHMKIATDMAKAQGLPAPATIEQATAITNSSSANPEVAKQARMQVAQMIQSGKPTVTVPQTSKIIQAQTKGRSVKPLAPLAARYFTSQLPQSISNAPVRSSDLSHVKGFAGAGADYQQSILAASSTVGVNPEILAVMGQLESSSGKHVTAARSSAKGPFQFIDSTWLGMLNKYGKQFGVDVKGQDRKDLLNLRYNNGLSAMMAALYVKENAKTLGIDPMDPRSSSKLYLAHFLGPQSAKKVLDGQELNNASKIVQANPNLKTGSAAELVKFSETKVAGALISTRQSRPMPVATARPSIGGDLAAGNRIQQTTQVARGSDQLHSAPNSTVLINAPQTTMATNGGQSRQSPIVLPINANNFDGTLDRLMHGRVN